MPWPLYAFDNYFEHADRPVPDAERWDIAREPGFSRLWLSINFTMPERVARMKRIPLDRDRTGLAAIAYTILDLQNPFPASPNVFDLIAHLRPGDTLGWKRALSDPAHDPFSRATDHSTLREIVLTVVHPGGCAMNMGNGLAALGIPVDCFATLGEPPHPAFAPSPPASAPFRFHKHPARSLSASESQRIADQSDVSRGARPR